mmetsp:Transcript_23930/g.49726  ORF Transcript_23930/g.49726 Transcript_23930/m.49726 type:complete len:89 (-) Transcript_23930:1710-1976(-)
MIDKEIDSANPTQMVPETQVFQERRHGDTYILEILELRHETYPVLHLATERRALRRLLWAQPLVVFFTHIMAARRMRIRVTREKALTC